MEPMGYILSGATTRGAEFQVRGDWERRIREGMMVVVEDSGRRILGVVTSIRRFNEFYEPGEVWSEAIREGHLPPSDLARRYVVAKLELIGVESGNGLLAVDAPPEPGAPVYPASRGTISGLVGGCSSCLIPLGTLYGYESEHIEAYLDISKVTMHAAVLGVTGSGKSNTVGVLIEELGGRDEVSIGNLRLRTLPLVVVDAHGDYIDYFEDPGLVPSYAEVVRLVFGRRRVSGPRGRAREALASINLGIYCKGGSCNTSELAELIYSLVRGGVEGAELQLSLLSSKLQEAAENGIDFNELFSRRDVFERFVDGLSKGAHQATAAAVERTLRAFRERILGYGLLGVGGAHQPLDYSFVESIVDPDEPKLVILDFSADGAPGLDLRTKQFIVSFVARLLFNAFVGFRVRGEDRVLAFVVEEAQNYAPNPRSYPVGYSVARDILASIATQGRKFGLSLILVSQRPAFIDPVVMSMMNTFIVHRVSPGDVRFVDTVTGGLPAHIRSKLTSLETGVAILTGQMNPLPHPVLVRVRRRLSHHMGSV